MTKVALTVIILILIAVGITVSLFWPSVLADNQFLANFVNHNLLSLLVVILTITFASVGNIHLSISKTQTSIQDAGKRAEIEEQFAKPLQAETESSAWLLFWALVACVVILLIKGSFADYVFIVSATHAAALILLFINAAVLYDIYGTVFALVGVDKTQGKTNGE